MIFHDCAPRPTREGGGGGRSINEGTSSCCNAWNAARFARIQSSRSSHFVGKGPALVVQARTSRHRRRTGTF